jgi:N-methylhydantoinase A
MTQPGEAGRLCIGIDVGGTFTDVVVVAPGTGRCVQAFKLPSSPEDPAQAVLAALDRVAAAHDIRNADACHGTTIGTNTLIERRGARTALVATQGFRDVIELRRQARPELYTFDQRISAPLVPPPLRFEVAGRLAYDGQEIEALPDPAALVGALQRAGIQAVAICLLNSYASDVHELRIAEAVRTALPGVFITVSSEVAPEAREYERTSTAVVNAYIGPAVSSYVRRLESGVAARGVASLAIVRSSGGLTSPRNAARQPVHLVESGPAAGLGASARFGMLMGAERVLAVDMGGTTAKAGVAVGGQPRTVTEFSADALVEGRNLGGFPILTTVLDLVEIGAGGGSIAWLDEAGVLKVGPRSAGARPGPACYGLGGTLPTVTDAHAVIGTLRPDAMAESGVTLDPGRAASAIEAQIARPRGWSVAAAAHAIIDIAVARMAEMVRLATLRRGLDPRDFVMVPSGGAGPLHAALIARQVGIRHILVPPMPGMFSALGATIADIRHDVGRSVMRALPDYSQPELAALFADLAARLDGLLAAEPVCGPVIRRRSVEMRFRGQLFQLAVSLGDSPGSVPDMRALEALFRAAYIAEYGQDLPRAVPELVAARMSAQVGRQEAALANFASPDEQEDGAAAWLPSHVEVIGRDGLSRSCRLILPQRSPGETVAGPAVVPVPGATVWVPEACRAHVQGSGGIAIEVDPAA